MNRRVANESSLDYQIRALGRSLGVFRNCMSTLAGTKNAYKIHGISDSEIASRWKSMEEWRKVHGIFVK